jgi:hypothetical protein
MHLGPGARRVLRQSNMAMTADRRGANQSKKVQEKLEVSLNSNTASMIRKARDTVATKKYKPYMAIRPGDFSAYIRFLVRTAATAITPVNSTADRATPSSVPKSEVVSCAEIAKNRTYLLRSNGSFHSVLKRLMIMFPHISMYLGKSSATIRSCT